MYIITHLSVGEQAGLYIWFTCSKKKGHPSARITLAVPREIPCSENVSVCLHNNNIYQKDKPISWVV